VRGGIVDHDPMEGLPVRRWEKMEVIINQDPKEEEKNDEGKDGTNSDWPWPDLPLPKDFALLPTHSQVCNAHRLFPCWKLQIDNLL
jgi:hypothetical protein